MKLRKFKKRVKKFCGKDNVKFHRDRQTGKLYMATRVSEALTYISNYWMYMPGM